MESTANSQSAGFGSKFTIWTAIGPHLNAIAISA